MMLCSATRVRAEDEHWSYSGHRGPAERAQADSSFATWQFGKVQSPIDIRGAKTAFGKLYPMNARPTQPLNGRVIEATR
jgi:carbonic anhydrase